MKATLSAIGLGAILACACNVAFGQRATTTQQGTANTAYTEQSTAFAVATITQIGNNNHAGDPVTKTSGIFQGGAGFAQGTASIYQRGNENTASVRQDDTVLPTHGDIRQVGNNNSAAITQHNVSFTDALIRQTGADNVVTVEQEITDVSFKGIQTGVGNFLSFRQFETARGPVTVTQTGAYNSVSVDQNVFFASGTIIDQVGDMNTVTSTMKGDAADKILQVGTGNTAATIQTDGFNSSDIVQKGSNNLARVTQGLGANDALIRQIGNDNSATVWQTGVGNSRNTAYIRQVGDGFVAAITQTGMDNHAGIYQH
jgi:hypothetical protein